MQIKPIKTEEDYQQALARLEEIFDAKPDTKEGDELEILGILVEKYEEGHFPIDNPDPVAAIEFRMDQMGMDQQDLTRIIGSKSRTSDLLNRKRPLSIRQIRLLHNALHIPADVLLNV
ncbi:type II toxin-antitoxin system HigA family antitoxin [Chlorobium sp. KB01]|uniref:helix-turn-helix domain-containing protein n=1 Tax=Chlorobium sp. KB01 TaxID=1917528 RepID=UPI0009778C2E|nr:transcriptional regulator [Chlorobium sp. KB01]